MVQRGRLRRISVFDIEARATPQLLLELELLLLLLAVALSRRKRELREVAAMAFISPVFWGKGRDAREKGIECKSRVFSVFFLVFAKKKGKKTPLQLSKPSPPAQTFRPASPGLSQRPAPPARSRSSAAAPRRRRNRPRTGRLSSNPPCRSPAPALRRRPRRTRPRSRSRCFRCFRFRRCSPRSTRQPLAPAASRTRSRSSARWARRGRGPERG